MAAKRALVSAVLTVTGASAVFTQDVEDMTDNIIDADYEDMAPNAAHAEEPEPDLETLFNELAAKSGLTTKKEKAALSKFVDITAQAQNRPAVSIIQSALTKHFDSFAAAFAKWQQANESKPKADASSQKEDPEAHEANDAPATKDQPKDETPVTREILDAVTRELTRLGVPDRLPPDMEQEFGTGDPSELSEPEGQTALKGLKAMK